MKSMTRLFTLLIACIFYVPGTKAQVAKTQVVQLTATANSDGILIRQNMLQDGQNFCSIEVRNEEGFKYSCIDPSDRSIYARINPGADGTLIFNVQISNFVLSRKKQP